MKPGDVKHVLMIVDDESSQREMIGGFFGGLGFEIVEAASAEEMLQSIASCALPT